MQFVLTLVVLAAFIASERTSPEVLGDANVRLWLVTGGMMFSVLIARIFSGLTTLQLTACIDRRQPLRRFARLRQLHLAVWLACFGASYWWLQWPRVVHADLGLADTFLLDELLLLAPLLLPLALAWAAYYDVEQLLLQEAGRRESRTRFGFVANKFRTELGLLLAPLLIVIAYQDALRLCFPELSGAGSWVVYAPLLLALLACFPWFVRWSWRAVPLDEGPLRERLANSAEKLHVPLNDILLWPTEGRMVNAAACGFFRGCRYVLLTDGLLRRLSPEEVEAIFAHELAHAKLRHLPLRIAALGVPLVVVQLASQLPQLSLLANPWLLLLAGGAYLVTLFAWYCRQLEHQADLSAATACSQGEARVRVNQPTTAGVERYVKALQKAADAAGGGEPRFARFHPRLSTRIEWLRGLPDDPRRCVRFQRRCRMFAWGLALCTAAVAAFALYGLI